MRLKSIVMKNQYPKHENDKPGNSILILGISPGFAPSPPESKTGKRVKKWFEACGISEEEYDWRNCVDTPGADPSLRDIKLHKYEVANYDKVVCLGNKPSMWCAKQGIDHLKVPHPSGINRAWNDPSTEPRVMIDISNYVNR